MNSTKKYAIQNTAGDIMPYIPTHPGEVLKEELQARGISQKLFSGMVGVPYTALNEILNGKRPMSVDFSLLVEAALGIQAEFFVKMQNIYNLQTARRDKGLTKRMDAIRGLAASLL